MLDDIVDLAGKQVPLTGGPIKDPTGVGPQHTGDKAVKGLKQVVAGPGDHRQGRGGVIAEYRMIPGYDEGPDAWKSLGLDVLKAANKRNTRSGIST